MLEKAVAIFFFVDEKLLFRYPFRNPFTIDLSNNTTVCDSGGAGTVPWTTRVQSRDAGNVLQHDTATCGAASTTSRSASQTQIPGLAEAAGVRYKPRNARRTQPVTSAVAPTASKGKGGDGEDESSRVTGYMASPCPAVSGGGSHQNRGSAAGFMERGSVGTRGSVAGHLVDGDDTCVGIETPMLLHLLRASFTACTTIQFAGATFLIYPLQPTSTRMRRMSAAERWLGHEASSEPTDSKEASATHPLAGSVGTWSFSAEENPIASRSSRVVLVVAMSRPDREEGAITNFVQIFMNVLLREELRVRYVARQIYRMEDRLRWWKRHSDKSEVNDDNVRNCAPSSGGGGGGNATNFPQTSEMFAQLLEDDELTLCKEICRLAQCIAASAPQKQGSANAKAVTSFSSSSETRHSHRGQEAINEGKGDSKKTPGEDNIEPVEFALRGLFSLPVGLLTGSRSTRHYHVAANVKLNPNYTVNLVHEKFTDRLSKSYGEAVGRRAVQQLPLSTIRSVFKTLPPPVRAGTLYRALERAYADASQCRRTGKLHQATHPSWAGKSSASLLHTAVEEQSCIADCEILVVEAVEYLRVCGALVINTGLTIVFTHCGITSASTMPGISDENRKRSCITQLPQTNLWPSASPAASVRVAPASLIGVMLLEGVRKSFSLDYDGFWSSAAGGHTASNVNPDNNLRTPTTPSTAKTQSSSPSSSFPTGFDQRYSDIQTYEVYCAWGDACPMCEELAAAPHLWKIGEASVRLVFPCLSPPVMEAAARRAQQGTRPVDPDCCSLLADQVPWFASTEVPEASSASKGTTPHQFYRKLTSECASIMRQGISKGDAVDVGASIKPAEEEKEEGPLRGSFGKTNEPSDGEITALMPGSIPVDARAWLTANCKVIEERLNADRRQRLMLWERAKGWKERQKKETEAASRPETQTAGQSSTGVALKRPGPHPGQRYRKREVVVSSTVPNAFLPLTPAVEADQPMLLHRLQPEASEAVVSGVPFSSPVDNGRAVPIDVLMQFVFHHIVVLLWGKTGTSVDVLLRLLECNLRRLPIFLAGLRLRELATVSSSSSNEQCGECGPLSSPECGLLYPMPHSQQEIGGDGDKAAAGGQHGEVGVDSQFQQAFTVFSELCLVETLTHCSQMTLEMMPTKLLLHSVVNAFSDVLLLGRGGSC
uniref:Uncharacterized protein TCIL3000_11_13010 n=1 Tax=Trypanosoma congolense (strain IL3000) TaxID=1068625 RepID=G0V2D1_TRYCI|nr:unnamed protein product [Trypanosoma congolense IL3000]